MYMDTKPPSKPHETDDLTTHEAGILKNVGLSAGSSGGSRAGWPDIADIDEPPKRCPLQTDPAFPCSLSVVRRASAHSLARHGLLTNITVTFIVGVGHRRAFGRARIDEDGPRTFAVRLVYLRTADGFNLIAGRSKCVLTVPSRPHCLTDAGTLAASFALALTLV